MGKKSKIYLYNNQKKIQLGIRKQPQIIKGSNVGFDISEIKKTSTKELKNILYLIIQYFTKRTRQKIQNSNFKNLYLRVKKELELRKRNDINTKIIFQIEDCKKKNKIKLTPIEEVIIPNFFNDKQTIQISNITNNNYINNNSSLSTASFEEENLNENGKYKICECNSNEMNKKNLELEKGIENDINYFMLYSKNNDFNYEYESNFFLNYDNNQNFPNDKDKEKEKEEFIFFPKY